MTFEEKMTLIRKQKNISHAEVGKFSGINVITAKNKKDMYARYIAELVFNEVNLSDFLLEKGCVKKFYA